MNFIVHGKDGFWAIEVKNAAKLHPQDLRGLRAFGEDYPEAKRLLLHRGRERLAIDGIACIPCEDFLLGLDPKRKALDAG